MKTVYHITEVGKKIPYQVLDDTPPEDYLEGVPIPYTDITTMQWGDAIIALHNALVENELYTIGVDKKHFLEIAKTVLLGAITRFEEEAA